METYFIRHAGKLDIDQETRDLLWREQRIAVHFPHSKDGESAEDCRSLNPSDYAGSARKAIGCLGQVAKNGGYVFAEYSWEDEALIGFVKPDSKIEIFKGNWGDIYGFQGRSAILKSLRLCKVKRIKPCDFAVTFAARPRQGTIMRWVRAGSVIANAVEGVRTDFALADLSPDQQEILCSEFLRSAEALAIGLPQLQHLTLPVGRTLRDIDIVGIARDKKPLFAQVTFAAENFQKKSRLARYANETNCHLIFFCDTPRLRREGKLLIVPIKDVAKRFRRMPYGKMWFRASKQLNLRK